MVTALVDQKVTNQRVREMVGLHSNDVSNLFRGLVEKGFLQSTGWGRWTSYHLPDIESDDYDESIDIPPPFLPNSVQQSSSSAQEEVISSQIQQLQEMAKKVRGQQRAPKTEMKRVILSACNGRFLSLQFLSRLVGRKPDALRQRHLTKLVKDGDLVYKHPERPNHPQQAYRSVEKPQQPELFQ